MAAIQLLQCSVKPGTRFKLSGFSGTLTPRGSFDPRGGRDALHIHVSFLINHTQVGPRKIKCILYVCEGGERFIGGLVK